jgi:hypothetical protein
VDNQPLAIGLTVTSGPTQPTISLLAILHRSTYSVETEELTFYFQPKRQRDDAPFSTRHLHGETLPLRVSSSELIPPFRAFEPLPA